MIGPEDEQIKQGPGAFEDAVTVELSDVDREVYALLRVARSEGGAGTASLALVCLGGETVAAVDDGVLLETAEPLERWRCRFEDGAVSLEAEVGAVSPPIDFDAPATAALTRAAGVHRYEQLCGVRGELRVGERRVGIDGVGRRTHAWGEPAGTRFRSLYAIAGDRAVIVTAVRPEDGAAHSAELIAAHLVRPESEPELFEDARLSTLYDAAGRPRTAGAELFLAGEEFPRRISGEAVCQVASEAEAVQAAGFRWSLEGEPAQGGYRVVSR
jgi:hypothetical protein